MKLRTLAAAIALAFSVPAAGQAQQAVAASQACLAPDARSVGHMSWFLGLNASDDLLTAWCRLQQVPGNVRLNVWFPRTNAHRSWETSLRGANLPAQRIVEIVQSLLPVTEGPGEDDKGMPFPRVLSNVVQLAAKAAPDNTPVGFAPEHPFAKELVLWEPIVLRIRPVALAGQEFTLLVALQPNLGMLSLGLQGRATDVRLRGWKGRMPSGNFMSGECADAIPFCNELPTAPLVHAPWIVDEVRLTAEGNNMTNSANAIIAQMVASQPNFVRGSNRGRFDTKTGSGSLTMSDSTSIMELQALGAPGGTKSISIIWKAQNSQGSVNEALAAALATFRNSTAVKPRPPVPDSLGGL